MRAAGDFFAAVLLREVAAGEAVLLRFLVVVLVAFPAVAFVDAFAEALGVAAAFALATAVFATAFSAVGFAEVTFAAVAVFRLEAAALMLDFATVLAGDFFVEAFLFELAFLLAAFSTFAVAEAGLLSATDFFLLPGEAFAFAGLLSGGLASVNSSMVSAALTTVSVAAKMLSAALMTFASSLSKTAAFELLDSLLSASVLIELVTSALMLSAALRAGPLSGAFALPAALSEPAELVAELRFLVLAAVRRTGICFLQPKCEFA